MGSKLPLYRLSKRAEQDLEEIWRYTLERWSAKQADKYVSDILDMMDAIGRKDVAGRQLLLELPEYLKVGVGSHFIVYRMADDGAFIVRVLHNRMDLEQHI